MEEGPTVEGAGEPEEPSEPTPDPTPGPEPEPAPVPPVPPVPIEEPVSEGEEEAEPQPEPEPEESETLTLYVSQSVGDAGLRLRKTASLGGALVAIEKAGTELTVLEPADMARAKVGVEGKWIHVSDPKRRQGYVAANYIELDSTPVAETPPVPPEPVPTDPVSDSEVEPATASFTVYVTSAASAGLRMRNEPNTNSTTLTILPAGSELKVLEGTSKMVGVYGKWFKVRESGGTEGYVAAWYVRK